MSLEQLQYEKSWMNVGDFATRETNESRVRADLQYFPDAIRNYINEVLIPGVAQELENLTLGAIPDGSLVKEKLDEEAASALMGKMEVVTLLAEDWDYAKCYVLASENIKDENTVIDMFVAPNATAAQRTVLRDADIICRSQTEGGITLMARGEKPTVDTQVLLIYRQDIAADEEKAAPRLVNHIVPSDRKIVVWDGLGDAPAVIDGAILLKIVR